MQHALDIRSLDTIVYYVQFSREDSHSAELESRKALEKKVHISDTCINRDMCDYNYILCHLYRPLVRAQIVWTPCIEPFYINFQDSAVLLHHCQLMKKMQDTRFLQVIVTM